MGWRALLRQNRHSLHRLSHLGGAALSAVCSLCSKAKGVNGQEARLHGSPVGTWDLDPGSHGGDAACHDGISKQLPSAELPFDGNALSELTYLPEPRFYLSSSWRRLLRATDRLPPSKSAL